MKRNLSLLLATILLSVAVAGCGGAKESAETSTAQTEAAEETVTAEAEAEPEEDPAELIEAALTEGLDYFYARNGKEVDDDKALAAFQAAADLGDAGALYYIGRLHNRKKDYEDAAAAYEKAIAGGNSMAKLALGLLYQSGDGVERDFVKARRLFEEAVAEGCVEANVGLGDIYQNGYGEETEDAVKAIEYFELAATGQEPEWLAYAYSSLAIMHSGIYDGVDKNLDKISEYGEKTAAVSETWSGEYLGWMGDAYRLADEYTSALEWYEKGAALENSTCMNQLGWMYQEGLGVEVDYEKAMEWYEKGVALDDRYCMNNLGWMYVNGFGVEVDYQKAMEWYEKGAALGQSDSMNNIGMMYENGLGVETDYEKALEWFGKSADLGNETAINNIKYMIDNGMISKEAAAQWLD